jgi:putative inorganic carbon (HCO3(-)) transporter
MSTSQPFLSRAALWLTFGSAAGILFSIAVSQILLALALAALLLSGERIRLPRIKWPLLLFIIGTVISLLFSGEPAAGLPQIRKFYVFCELLIVFSCLRERTAIRWLFLSWAGFASIDALRGLVQFVGKLRQAHQLGMNAYDFYVAERITGFTSHWNTFSAEEMFALIMLGSLLLFSPVFKKRSWIWLLCAGLMAMAVLLAETRGVWIATAVAALYLIWYWNRKLVLLVPALILLVFLLSPAALRERFESLVKPGQSDSNAFRLVTWKTGLRMIAAHPWLGLGPEGPHYHFDEWLPPDAPRPLPSGWYGHLHNIYLQYAAERGIPTMLVMMWILGQIMYDFNRGLRKLPPGRSNRRFLLHGGIAVVLAVLTEGVVEYNLGDSEVLTMFLVVVGCGYLALEKDLSWEP